MSYINTQNFIIFDWLLFYEIVNKLIRQQVKIGFVEMCNLIDSHKFKIKVLKQMTDEEYL